MALIYDRPLYVCMLDLTKQLSLYKKKSTT